MNQNLSKNERIALKKQQGLLKDRHTRKLEKFSSGFEEIFAFFLSANRAGILSFAGEDVEVLMDESSFSAKEGFRRFEDGQFKNKSVTSRQSNILRSVIIGKKAWGLWVRQWSQGIGDHTFTLDEIIKVFTEKGIRIPDSLMVGFKNEIQMEKEKRIDEYFKSRKQYVRTATMG